MTSSNKNNQQFRFELGIIKAEVNLRKHGVSFAEAESVFDDTLSAVFGDPDHSIDEDRLIIKGHSDLGRLLLVCFTWRGGVLRIISARQLTKQEIREYEEGKKYRR